MIILTKSIIPFFIQSFYVVTLVYEKEKWKNIPFLFYTYYITNIWASRFLTVRQNWPSNTFKLFSTNWLNSFQETRVSCFLFFPLNSINSDDVARFSQTVISKFEFIVNIHIENKRFILGLFLVILIKRILVKKKRYNMQYIRYKQWTFSV